MSPEPLPETQTLDLRVHAVHRERGVVESALAGAFPRLRALTPASAWAGAPLSLRARPDGGAPQVTEALHGEALEVLEQLPGGWAWVRTLHDGYLGYVQAGAHDLTPTAPASPVTVTAPRAHLFAAPSIRAPLLSPLGAGATLSTLDSEPALHGDYRWWRVAFRDRDAYLHVAATKGAPPDLDTFAAAFLSTPYLWGGRSAWGLDCSGLSQLWGGRDAHGRSRLPRDADQQRTATRPVETPQPGDLAFFPGHVGLMLDERRMLHANATHMAVTVDTLGEGEYGRRLQATLLGFGRLEIGRPDGRP